MYSYSSWEFFPLIYASKYDDDGDDGYDDNDDDDHDDDDDVNWSNIVGIVVFLQIVG